MPTNKKEGIIFTTIMCSMMVVGMSLYNLQLHDNLALMPLVAGLVPGFVVAFVLDVFVVGVIAKKIAFRLPIKKENKLQLILTISSLMVLGMVTFMSLFGVLIEGGIPDNLWAAYSEAWRMNVIVALLLQLLLVGPMSRTILGKIQANGQLVSE
jgi:biotin transporter BioY